MFWLAMAVTARAEVPANEPPRDYELGAGLFFNAGGVFMTQPADNKEGLPGLPYNGFGGFSPGAGLSIDFRFHGIVGLELDFTRWAQKGLTTFDVNDVTYHWSIQQAAWQVPLLLKLTAPVGILKPQLFVGPEFIFPGKTSVNPPADLPGDIAITADADPWTDWTFGLGFELAIPIEGVDLRIPFQIRLSDYPGEPKSAFDRATYHMNNGQPFPLGNPPLTGIDYVSEWQYQAAITLGLSYTFL
jgi:hypothetical protein